MKRFRISLAALLALALFGICSLSATSAEVLRLPDSLKAIEDEAFMNARGFTEVVLPDGLERIGKRAFVGSGLTAVALPASVTYIADSAFEALDGLTVTAQENTYAYRWAALNGYIREPYPESDHPYANNEDNTWTYQIEGADALDVVFSQDTETESNFDVITILDKSGAEVGQYSGTALAGQTVRVEGSTFSIRLTSDGVVTKHGFTITEVRAVLFGVSVTGITPSAVVADAGDTVMWTVETTGNHTPFTYAYILYRDGQVAARSESESNVFSHTFSEDGVYTLEVSVTDIHCAVSAMTGGEVRVGQPVVLLSVTAENAYVPLGESIVWHIATRGGTMEMAYACEVFKDGESVCADTVAAPLFRYQTDVPGKYTLRAWVTDANENVSETVQSDITLVRKYNLVTDFAYFFDKTDNSITITGYVGTNKNMWISPIIDGYPVRRIADGAFNERSDLTGDLYIPESVTSIGGSAFYNCGLTGKLIIPTSVTNIGSYAFYGCSGFTGDLVIPNSVKNIDSAAFNRCSGFSGRLILPDSITSIESIVFYECSGFTGSLVIPQSVTSIRNHAFFGCSGFTGNFVIPEGVKTIGDYAFCDCSGFTGDLMISNSVINIGVRAFSGCNGFTGDLMISRNIEIIEEFAFSYCAGFTGDLMIPQGVTSIGEGAFEGCSSFVGDLVIPDFVIDIGRFAFYGCDGFNGNLVLSQGLRSIGDSAFYECSSFTGDLVIPESVISIGCCAFTYCSGFTGDLRISKSVTSIESGVFSSCSGFTGELVIPNNVTSIGESAFSDCNCFTGDLVIPESVTSIGDHAFANCSGFTGDLVIPESVTSIGESAFGGCSGFTGELVMLARVTSIGSWAFHWCSGFIGDLVIPESVTSIEDYAFNGCSGFTGDLVIPESVTSIGNSSFSSCSGFTGDLLIPKSVTSIGPAAFFNCSGFMGDLVIPDGIKKIGQLTFDGCIGITDAYIPASVTAIDNAFSYHHPDLIIHGEAGSYAEEYADANGITFSTEMLYD